MRRRKWKRPKREALMDSVIHLACLPKENRSMSYFSRRQLEALIVYLEHSERKLDESVSVENILRQSKESEIIHGQDQMGTSEFKNI